jgi:hypothetical protein
MRLYRDLIYCDRPWRDMRLCRWCCCETYKPSWLLSAIHLTSGAVTNGQLELYMAGASFASQRLRIWRRCEILRSVSYREHRVYICDIKDSQAWKAAVIKVTDMRTAHSCCSVMVCTRLHCVTFQKTVVGGDPEVRYSGRIHSASELNTR